MLKTEFVLGLFLCDILFGVIFVLFLSIILKSITMKKILLIAIMFIAYNSANAQISYGIKGGLNYNYANIESVKDLAVNNKVGWNVGGFLRVKIPILGLYVQGEPTYTKMNAEVEIDGETTNLGSNRFDLPVLAGFKLAIFRIYAGPVMSWNLGTEVDISDVEIIVNEKMSVGGQVGAGVELGPIMVDVRYEAGIKHALETAGVDTGDFNFDNRGSQLILGLAYKF